MATTINISHTSCIRCGKCTKVCPSAILIANAQGEVSPERVDTCISCGHCVAICPTGSVDHNHFPVDKVHPIDRSKLPTPEQVMLLCRARRSNRAFSNKLIPKEFIDKILEAAYRAPTASNRQQVAFTVITDPEMLRAVSLFTIDTFASAARKLENPLLRPVLRHIMSDAYRYLPALKRIVKEFEHGTDRILRGASALILIHTPKQNAFGVIDANLAYQNGSLMAESLGVNQFYTGFVYMATKRDRHQRLAKMLGIDGTIHAGMALGMPQFSFPNYIDKKPINVSK